MPMKLAYSTLACPNWTLERALAAVPEYGYDGIELRLLDGDVIMPDLPAEQRRRVRQASQAAGVPIACFDTSVRIAQPDPAEREVQVRDGLACLELAAEWSAPLIRVFGRPPEGTPQPEANVAAADGLARLAPRARELGVAIVIETHDAFYSSLDVMAALDQVSDSSVGVLWDLYGPHIVGEPLAEVAERFRPRLLHVHVNDGHPSEAEGGWTQTLLGEGVMPVRQAVQLLKGQGYDGWLSVEWSKKWFPELAEPEVALPQHAAMLRQYLAGAQ